MNLVVFRIFISHVFSGVCVCEREISNMHTHTPKSTGISEEGWVGSCCCVWGEFVANVLAVHLHLRVYAHISLL